MLSPKFSSRRVENGIALTPLSVSAFMTWRQVNHATCIEPVFDAIQVPFLCAIYAAKHLRKTPGIAPFLLVQLFRNNVLTLAQETKRGEKDKKY